LEFTNNPFSTTYPFMPKKKEVKLKEEVDGDTQIKKIIGSRIKRVRRHFDRTADWVARRVGIKRGALTQIENGRNNITAALLWKIASALSCDIKEFFPGVPDSKTLSELDYATIARENEQAAEWAKKAFK